MNADALVGDLPAKNYYMKFPQMKNRHVTNNDLQFDKDKIRLLHRPSFEDVLKQMVQSENRNFLLDFHGTEDGFVMPLYDRARHVVEDDNGRRKSQELRPDRRTLEILMTYRQVREQREAAGDDLARWRAILRLILSDIRRMDPAFNVNDRNLTVAQARGLVEAWIKSIQEPGALNSPLRRIDAIVELMRMIERMKIDLIEIRACKLGASPDTLKTYRQFFNANQLGAPTLRSGMGAFSVSVFSRKSVDEFLQRRNAHNHTFLGLPGGLVVVRITNPQGIRAEITGAAESKAALNDWINRYLMPGVKYTGGAFPIHFLFSNPSWFPMMRAYWNHIEYAKR